MGRLALFITTKLGIAALGGAVVLVLGLFSQCRDSRRVREIDRLEARVDTTETARQIYRRQAIGYKAVADSSWAAVLVLGAAVDNVTRRSDSLSIRSHMDAARARRQALEAETALRNLRTAMDRDTTLQSCSDLFPSSSAVWY